MEGCVTSQWKGTLIQWTCIKPKRRSHLESSWRGSIEQEICLRKGSNSNWGKMNLAELQVSWLWSTREKWFVCSGSQGDKEGRKSGKFTKGVVLFHSRFCVTERNRFFYKISYVAQALGWKTIVFFINKLFILGWFGCPHSCSVLTLYGIFYYWNNYKYKKLMCYLERTKW